MVQALIEKGADVTLTDKSGRTVLHAAVGAGSLSVFRVLQAYARKVDWNARTDDGTTALILAVRLSMDGEARYYR